MNGKRPVFVDDIASVFFFPYLHIRFVEIPPAAAAEAGLDLPVPVAAGTRQRRPRSPSAPPPMPTGRDLEIDEDFLRRIREV